MKEHISSERKSQEIKTNIKQYVSLLSLLFYYVSHHEKVFVVRFDLHYPLKMLNEKEMVPLPQYLRDKYLSAETRHRQTTNTMQNFRRKLERPKENKL